MWLWRLRNEPWELGGRIVPVLWKGDVDQLTEMPELRRLQLFDWTSCVHALEAWEWSPFSFVPSRVSVAELATEGADVRRGVPGVDENNRGCYH